MARQPKNREFLGEIAHQLREGLRRKDELSRMEGRRYTREEAARDLGVSRSSLQFYLAGTHMPSSDVLRRAMELWGIEFIFRDRKLSIVDLFPQDESRTSNKPQPIQLGLWDSIKKLESSSLAIRVEKKNPQSITLQVEIGFKG